MNQAIEISNHKANLLQITSRKKLAFHSLICVEKGFVLIRLGKLEYAIGASQCFWLPADSLFSLSFMPNSEAKEIRFSQRSVSEFPSDAGYVTPSRFIFSILFEYSQVQSIDWDMPGGRLLRVLGDHICNASPSLQHVLTTKLALNVEVNTATDSLMVGVVSGCNENSCSESTNCVQIDELQSIADIFDSRELLKLIRSGKKLTDISSLSTLNEEQISTRLIEVAGYR